jgi:FkbM family methyltransferase
LIQFIVKAPKYLFKYYNVFLNKLNKVFSSEIIFKLLSINPSYSQFGEDKIIACLLNILDVSNPVYLDIGANEPKYESNTYLFYRKGCKGVLVEPNPKLCKKLMRYRRRDTILNAGIGINQEKEGTFYLFTNKYNILSSFSEKSAYHWENIGMKGVGKIKTEKTIKIPMISINQVFDDYFKNRLPDFVSIDVEGLDLEILQSIDFNKYRPNILCCETSYYDEYQQVHKEMKIIEYMRMNGYFVYADTFINTIFVNKKWFDERKR